MREVFETVSPVDGSVWNRGEMIDAAEISRVAARARRAGKEWRNTPLADRLAALEKFLPAFDALRDSVVESVVWQVGRPARFAGGEVDGVRERCAHMLAAAEEALADQSFADRAGFTRFIRREPHGVVLVVAPWNYPYLTAMNAVFPALVAGNAVVLKHSRQTAKCADVIARAFSQTGLPEGLFQFFQASHDSVEQSVGRGDFDFAGFTGSVEGGRRMERAAAGRFIGMNLELGGKDAAYVREDADLDFAARELADGAFFNSGQCCCGIERIYIHESRFADFSKKLAAAARGLILGRPDLPETTLGPLVSAKAADKVRGQIAAAIDSGARPLLDEGDFSKAGEGGAYMAPQILCDVNHEMDFMREETFGPAAGLMPVRDDDDAIARINDSRYGLTSSVWTRDEQAALRIGDAAETGVFFMNRCDYLDPALPWTGVKETGRGASLSRLGYDALTRPKSFHLRRAG